MGDARKAHANRARENSSFMGSMGDRVENQGD